MVSHKQKISVEIYNRIYELVVDSGDELEYVRTAKEVDDKMREIAKDTNIADTSKLAVLTALNMAYDYNRLKDTKNYSNEVVNKKIDDLVSLLNTVMV